MADPLRRQVGPNPRGHGLSRKSPPRNRGHVDRALAAMTPAIPMLVVEPDLGVQGVRERRHRAAIGRPIRDGVRLDLEHASPVVGRLDTDHGHGLRYQHHAARDRQGHERRQLILPADLAGEAEPPHTCVRPGR